MSKKTVELSADEREKLAAYHKAVRDLKSGALKVAKAVLADGGMKATGEMPQGLMVPGRRTKSLTERLAKGTMPRPAMQAGIKDNSGTPKGEMPRNQMN